MGRNFADRPDVAVVSLCVDTDEAAWKSVLEQERAPAGALQLRINPGDRETFLQAYRFEGPTVYKLIDKSGLFIDAAVPEPSHTFERNLLNRLIRGE